jgi:ABC-type branched-subunit amino acid transport system permease subunit
MFKRSILLGLVSGLLAGVAGVIYAHVYHSSLGADFSKVAPTVRIIASSLFGGVLAAVGYALLNKTLKEKGEIVFNFLFSVISFVTLLAPFAVKLPLDVETPELFPGMVIPMHFFPALAWFTLKPLFIKK